MERLRSNEFEVNPRERFDVERTTPGSHRRMPGSPNEQRPKTSSGGVCIIADGEKE